MHRALSQPVLWLPLLILLLGFALRLALYDVHGLDGDDGVSLSHLSYAVPALVQGLRTQEIDVHPPLYFVLLKGWTSLAGQHLLSLRLLNIWLDVLLGAALLRTGRLLFGASWIVGLLWALSPLLLYSDGLTRMYTLLAACAGLSVLSVFAAQRAQRPALWYGLLGLFAAAALYTHIIALLLVGGLGVVLLLQALLKQTRLRHMALGMGALLLAGLAYLPFALPQFERYARGGDLGGQNPNLIADLPLLPGQVLLTLLTHQGVENALVGLFLLLALLIGSAWLWRRAGRATLPLLALFWAMFAATLLMIISTELYRPRYLTVLLPPFALLVGAIVVRGAVGEQKIVGQPLRRSHKRPSTGAPQTRASVHDAGWHVVAFIALLALFGLSILGIRANLAPSIQDDFRAAAHYLEQHARPGELILIVPDWGQHAFQFHYQGEAQVQAMFSGVSDDTHLDSAFDPLRERYERIWLVRFQAAVSDPANRVPAWFASRAATITEVFPASLQITGYDFTPTADRLPPEATFRDESVGDLLRLHGVVQPVRRGSPTDTRLHPPSRWIALTLYWEALAPLEGVQLQLRLTKEDGQTWGLALERANDLLRRVPLASWQVGAIYEVDYDINLNPAAPPGNYTLEAIITQGEQEWRVPVGAFVIE